MKENSTLEENQKTSKMKKKNSVQPLKAKTKNNGFFQKMGRYLIISVVFLLIGSGLVYFLVFQPANKEFSANKIELDRLLEVEKNYENLQSDYLDLNTRHNVAVTLVDIYQIQNNVNIARIALLDNNPTRLSIALGYVEQDIDTLDIGEFPEKIDLSTRVDAIKSFLPNQKSQALAELESLFDDLLLLANNLEITE